MSARARFTARMIEQEIAGYYVGEKCAGFIRTQVQPYRDEIAKGIGPDGKVLKFWEVKADLDTHSDDVLAAIAAAKK